MMKGAGLASSRKLKGTAIASQPQRSPNNTRRTGTS